MDVSQALPLYESLGCPLGDRIADFWKWHLSDRHEFTTHQQDRLALHCLYPRPLSVEELEQYFHLAKIDSPRRLAKETAWRLAEYGKARFNSQWNLEIVPAQIPLLD